jgi:dTDP-4-dehydrorhamnose 3,5-epimerase
MKFHETKLKGSYTIQYEPFHDERGYFERTFCKKEFEDHGLDSTVIQCNASYNKHKGTLRGMHYQTAPFQEVKLVRCIAGSIYDVIIDLRPGSPTYCQWFATELTSTNGRAIYIPGGFAHGFQTLEDNSMVLYNMSSFYSPEHARGVRWNDPAFNIQWPHNDPIISQKDREYKDF